MDDTKEWEPDLVILYEDGDVVVVMQARDYAGDLCWFTRHGWERSESYARLAPNGEFEERIIDDRTAREAIYRVCGQDRPEGDE